MDVPTKFALEESIAHWRDNEAVLCWSEVMMGSGSCALCRLFHAIYNCRRCPVKERTGEPYCNNTPYAAALDAKDSWMYGDDEVTWQEGHEFIVMWRLREEFKNAARDEIRFLESLREENQ